MASEKDERSAPTSLHPSVLAHRIWGELDMVVVSVILVLNMQRQEDHKFEVNLVCRIRPCLKKQTNKKPPTNQKSRAWSGRPLRPAKPT